MNIEVITGLIGAVVGFILSESSGLIKEIKTNTRKKRSTGTILKKEIEYNYKIFTNFIKVINEHDISNKKPNNIHLILLNNLITFPFPIYSKDAYVNQFSTLTAYYSEKEIDYIINFLCEKMDRITSIKNTATYLKEIETDANNIVTGETGMFKGTDMLHINRTFIEKAPNFWSDRKLEFKQLIELSNNILTEMN